MEPVLADYQSFHIHIVIKNYGFANNFTYETRNDLIERLKQFHIQCFFTSTDEDKFFKDEHESAFNEYKQLLESGSSFENIISILKKHISRCLWPISDPLHSLTRIRDKTLFRKISLSLLEKFTKEELDAFISFKNCLNDKSSLGSMKDSYPLSIRI